MSTAKCEAFRIDQKKRGDTVSVWLLLLAGIQPAWHTVPTCTWTFHLQTTVHLEKWTN